MFSSLNSANSKWRRVAEDPGLVGKYVILDEKGNTKSKVISGQTINEFTYKAEYLSSGFRQNLMLATNLAATATSRLSCLSSKVSREITFT